MFFFAPNDSTYITKSRMGNGFDLRFVIKQTLDRSMIKIT